VHVEIVQRGFTPHQPVQIGDQPLDAGVALVGQEMPIQLES